MTDERATKVELAEEISQLAHEYSERGLSQEEIADVLQWQTQLAESRRDSAKGQDLSKQN